MFNLVPMNRREMGLFGEMGKLFDDPFFRSFGREESFKVDVVDKGDHFILEAELPGLKRDEVDVSVDGDCLTISARREEEKSEKENNYVFRERRIGSYARRFDITNVNAEEIQGDFEDGILTLTMPKKDPNQSRQRKIALGEGKKDE